MLQLDLCFKVDNNEHLHYFAFLVLNALKAATTNMYNQSDWKAMIRVIPQWQYTGIRCKDWAHPVSSWLKYSKYM